MLYAGSKAWEGGTTFFLDSSTPSGRIVGKTFGTYGLRTAPPHTDAEVRSVRIFGQVVPADVGGNIMYGFVGALAFEGEDEANALRRMLEISEQGDRIQHRFLRGDDPEDQAAVRFGYGLGRAFVDPAKGLDVKAFTQNEFSTRWLSSPLLPAMTRPTQNLRWGLNYLLIEPEAKDNPQRQLPGN